MRFHVSRYEVYVGLEPVLRDAAADLGAKLVFDDFSALPGLVAHLAPRLRPAKASA